MKTQKPYVTSLDRTRLNYFYGHGKSHLIHNYVNFSAACKKFDNLSRNSFFLIREGGGTKDTGFVSGIN